MQHTLLTMQTMTEIEQELLLKYVTFFSDFFLIFGAFISKLCFYVIFKK